MTRALCLILAMTLLAACHNRAPSDPIVLDGSSTAFPLAEAVAHEFMKANKGAAVTVTLSGTGTGFVKFCRGQLDIANASRPITVEEQKACEAASETPSSVGKNSTFWTVKSVVVRAPGSCSLLPRSSFACSARNPWAAAVTDWTDDVSASFVPGSRHPSPG